MSRSAHLTLTDLLDFLCGFFDPDLEELVDEAMALLVATLWFSTRKMPWQILVGPSWES